MYCAGVRYSVTPSNRESIVLFRGEIVIIQVFDEDISSLAIAKTEKLMLLPNLVDKISMTSLL